ncbi:hypothetical protein ACH347_34215 [Saccharopolyspora sp. 5N102]|uniref:hypothetical protein n=1 Tax=Saccharopolyspora sp. 5N102 TaxID=3375155 RepID=UPI00379E59DB
MSDDWSPDVDHVQLEASLDKLVEGVLRTPEIHDELERARLSESEILADVLADELFRAQAAGRYHTVVDHTQELRDHEKVEPPWWESGWRPDPWQWGALAFAAVFPTGSVLLAFSLMWPLPWLWQVLLVIAMYHFDPITRKALHVGIPATTWARLQWGRKRRVLLLKMPLLHYGWKQAIREEIVLPEVREKINNKRSTLFDHHLRIRDARGLRSADDLSFIIQTKSVEALRRELHRLNSGAIALAGSRGAGKTTLINAIEAGRLPRRDNRPILTIKAAAPAKYEPRDFVLHLHALTCRIVLSHLKTVTGAPTGDAHYDRWHILHRRARFRENVAVTTRRLIRTFALCLFSTAVACLFWYDIHTVATQFATDTIVLLNRLRNEPLSAVIASVGSSPALRTIAWCVLALGFVRGFFGFASVALGIMRAVLARSVRGTAVSSQRLKQWWRGSATRRALVRGVNRLFTLADLAHLAPRFSLERDRSEPIIKPYRLDSALTALQTLTEQQLRRIRFLQTHTEGWSGKLNAPKNIGMGFERSIQHAEQALTHPEIVEELRNFLHATATVLRRTSGISLIVAIDELDKISSPEQAHELLNEIKGVFGVPNCIFVVSVSEDALTAFERRGVPVRDALDSAFATMIPVAPFTLDESRNWLKRRVIGLSDPFICLCHCLSGGVPRELARTAAGLYDLHESHAEPDLELVANLLVTTDLTNKIRAFSHATHQLDPSPDISTFVLTLNTTDPATLSDPVGLDRLAIDLQPSTDCDITALTALRWEAAAYLYFCATIQTIFTNELKEAHLEQLTAPTNPQGLELLTKAKQALSLSPQLAWAHLTSFREANNIAPPTRAREHRLEQPND